MTASGEYFPGETMKFFKKVGATVLALFLIVVYILLINVIDPIAFTSTLEKGYWGGYYDSMFGKVWCLAKFYKHDGETRMLLNLAGAVDVVHFGQIQNHAIPSLTHQILHFLLELVDSITEHQPPRAFSLQGMWGWRP